MANLAFTRIGRCFVLVQNEQSATDEEWSRWVRFVAGGGEATSGRLGVLVMSAGGSPTPKQRKQIHELMPRTGGGVETAILLPSLVARTIVTAMSLFNPKVRAFAPDRLADALDYLGVADASRPDLIAAAHRLHDELGIAYRAR